MRQNRRILIFGRPGSGKTTLTVLEMIKALKRGDVVYSNIKINWFGELFLMTSGHYFFNQLYSFFGRLLKGYNSIKLSRLYNTKAVLEDARDNVVFNNNIPNVNLTDIYFKLYFIDKKIADILKHFDNISTGYFKSYYFPKNRFQYTEDLESAISALIHQALLKPDDHYLLAFDEGFVDLEHGKKIPRYITNFFNQTRKLNCDVIISSQRPVAVYPSYRALCDYMVLVNKSWFGYFNSTKFFVDDNADALPSTGKDKEGNDKGKNYLTWRGADCFPYFDTRQSIGLKKLLNQDFI